MNNYDLMLNFNMGTVIKAVGIIELKDTIRFVKYHLHNSKEWHVNFLRNFNKDHAEYFIEYFPLSFKSTNYIEGHYLIELFAHNYLKHQLRQINLEILQENLVLIDKFVNLKCLVKEWILTPKNWWTVVYRKKKDIMGLFPNLFKDYTFIYDKIHPIKISKERLLTILSEPCLYPGYIIKAYLPNKCTFCSNPTNEYFNVDSTHKYICDNCNPKIHPFQILGSQKSFHNYEDMIELINFTCKKFDTPLYATKSLIRRLNLENIEETRFIRPLLKLQCWEFIQAINKSPLTEHIAEIKHIILLINNVSIQKEFHNSFYDSKNRKYITFKYSHAFLKYCYEHMTETIPQNKFLDFCEF
jgi:hypothetical protein